MFRKDEEVSELGCENVVKVGFARLEEGGLTDDWEKEVAEYFEELLGVELGFGLKTH